MDDTLKEQFEIQAELLELSIKAGRRMMHDFDHLISQSNLDKDDVSFFRDRAEMWRKIFYPDDGMKNYRARIHHEINQLNSKISRLENLLKKHGIDPNEDLPF